MLALIVVLILVIMLLMIKVINIVLMSCNICDADVGDGFMWWCW